MGYDNAQRDYDAQRPPEALPEYDGPMDFLVSATVVVTAVDEFTAFRRGLTMIRRASISENDESSVQLDCAELGRPGHYTLGDFTNG